VQVTYFFEKLFIHGFLHKLVFWEQQDYVLAFQKLDESLVEEQLSLAEGDVGPVDFVRPVFF
jgi:hypothetical protein